MNTRVRKYLNKLKRDFPLRKPIRVRTYDTVTNFFGDKIFGTIQDKGDRFEIWLLRHQDEDVMIDTLFHEWTHALLWPKCTSKHTDLFFKAYGAIYRHYLE